jgi:hypothetical protein
MKRALFAVVAALALVGYAGVAPVPPSIHAHSEAAQDPKSITVYVTKSGERYHRDGCQYLRQSKIAVSLAEAVSKGFTPCRVCKPPVIAR